MATGDLASLEEFNELFLRNCKMTGFGVEGVTQHTACPFCAEPDFQVFRIIDVHEEIVKNATCRRCGRSARSIVTHVPGGVEVEAVQTGGEDPPEWYAWPMRRVDE